MEWLELVAVGLAGWRVAAMLSYERGPLDVFLRLRRRAGIQHDVRGEPNSWAENPLAGLLSCVWCLTPWTCAAMWGIWQWRQELVFVLAAAGLAVAVERWNKG